MSQLFTVASWKLKSHNLTQGWINDKMSMCGQTCLAIFIFANSWNKAHSQIRTCNNKTWPVLPISQLHLVVTLLFSNYLTLKNYFPTISLSSTSSPRHHHVGNDVELVVDQAHSQQPWTTAASGTVFEKLQEKILEKILESKEKFTA